MSGEVDEERLEKQIGHRRSLCSNWSAKQVLQIEISESNARKSLWDENQPGAHLDHRL